MAIPVIGGASNTVADVAPDTQAIKTAQYPFDFVVGGTVGGSYQITSKSGVMAAGLAANSPIYSFRNANATALILLRRIKLTAWTTTTGFAAGVATFDLLRATSWTAADTGGVTDTITTTNGKLRTSTMNSITVLSEIRHSSTAALAAGTRTLDAQALDSINVNASTVANTVFVLAPPYLLSRKPPEEYPLILGPSEGVVVQATVPATGTWSWALTAEWDETLTYPL